jgi:hypothetical protein
MLHGQRLAGATLALGFNHWSDLQLEARIKGSLRFLGVHVGGHLGLKKPIVVSF